MGKLILEVPAAVNMKLKVGGIPEGIKKLTQLKKSNRKSKNALKRIQKFKGIAKYKDIEGSKDEWYYQ
jgi:hypothetical protein